MGKLLSVVGLLFVLEIQTVPAQDSSFFLIGPSFGINRSWRSYDQPISAFKTDPSNGFEGGLNVFHKSKGKFGFLGALGYLQTESSITAYDYFSSTTIETSEATKWLTIEGTALFFPLPKSRSLPFFGTGLSVVFLDRADASIRITRTNDETKTKINLEDFRNENNYQLKLMAGITIHQFDKHRIVLLATCAKTLRAYSKNSTGESIGVNPLAPLIFPASIGNDFAINTFTVKLMMAL